FNLGLGKVAITAGNVITGASALTKNGVGSLSITSGENNTGNWSINAGVIEAQTATSLGAAGVTVTVNGDGSSNVANSGELAITNLTDNHPFILNGEILSGVFF